MEPEKKKKRKKRRKKKQNQFTPFSKKNIIYARIEAYVFSFALIILVLLDKDVSSIAVLLSLAWSGYKLLQCFYIWLCKHEHLMDKQIELKKLGVDTSSIDEELSSLENEEINIDETY